MLRAVDLLVQAPATILPHTMIRGSRGLVSGLVSGLVAALDGAVSLSELLAALNGAESVLELHVFELLCTQITRNTVTQLHRCNRSGSTSRRTFGLHCFRLHSDLCSRCV